MRSEELEGDGAGTGLAPDPEGPGLAPDPEGPGLAPDPEGPFLLAIGAGALLPVGALTEPEGLGPTAGTFGLGRETPRGGEAGTVAGAEPVIGFCGPVCVAGRAGTPLEGRGPPTGGLAGAAAGRGCGRLGSSGVSAIFPEFPVLVNRI